MSTKQITLTQNQVAVVDEEDFDRITLLGKWCAAWSSHPQSFYAQKMRPTKIDGSRGTLIMHREIMGVSADTLFVVDHINHDTLDNRKSNLRVVTRAKNLLSKKVYKNSASGFKGCCFHKRIGKWQAYLTVEGSRHNLGYFSTAEQAAVAYDIAATSLHGEFAYLNFREIN